MNNNRLELAIYVINLKIANEIKNNKESNYEKFKEKLEKLYKEKGEIYINKEETIDKVLTKYLEELKGS